VKNIFILAFLFLVFVDERRNINSFAVLKIFIYVRFFYKFVKKIYKNKFFIIILFKNFN